VLEKTTAPKPLKKAEDLVFGQNFTGRTSRHHGTGLTDMR
jgi:hypothetical protein